MGYAGVQVTPLGSQTIMEELHNIRAEIVSCKNKTKDATFVDVKVSELQSKTQIMALEQIKIKLLLWVTPCGKIRKPW